MFYNSSEVCNLCIIYRFSIAALPRCTLLKTIMLYFFVLAPLPIQDLELVCSHEPWISGVTNVALDDAGPPHEGKNSLAQKILQRYFILTLNINSYQLQINYTLFFKIFFRLFRPPDDVHHRRRRRGIRLE